MNSKFKHAIIVGGSRGIGFAIAQKFLRHSFNVTMVSRDPGRLQQSVQMLKVLADEKKIVAQVDYSVCDISKEADIIETCQSLLDSHPGVDVLVNSAGITHNRLLAVTKSDDVRRILETNLTGTILFTKLISKQMVRQKMGHIINIGSMVGSTGNSGQTVYAASKSALVGFTKSLAKELGRKNVTVNLIEPGFIHTDMTREMLEQQKSHQDWSRLIPLQRIGQPEEVAQVAYFLAVKSSYITGAVLPVDGGLGLGF